MNDEEARYARATFFLGQISGGIAKGETIMKFRTADPQSLQLIVADQLGGKYAVSVEVLDE